jgi:DNA mismatch endonuclease (patch repair protein)
MDMFTTEQRSAIMARIRSVGTSPELRVYAIVRDTLGSRWRVERNVRALPGNPDVVIPSLALAIFADGCFFHGCPHHSRVPKTNADYWGPKISRNVRRDALRRRELCSLGLDVWCFWEHDLKGSRLKVTHDLLADRLRQCRLEISQPMRVKNRRRLARLMSPTGP